MAKRNRLLRKNKSNPAGSAADQRLHRYVAVDAKLRAEKEKQWSDFEKAMRRANGDVMPVDVAEASRRAVEILNGADLNGTNLNGSDIGDARKTKVV